MGTTTGVQSTAVSQHPDELKREKARIASLKWRKANLAKSREQSSRSKKKQREKDPEKFAKRNKDWRIKNAEKLRWYEVARKFGINQEEYAKLHESQNGVCAICNNSETATRNGVVRALAVDHCHETGRVRGLLCSNCNTGIGKLKDSITVLQSAIRYLSN